MNLIITKLSLNSTLITFHLDIIKCRRNSSHQNQILPLHIYICTLLILLISILSFLPAHCWCIKNYKCFSVFSGLKKKIQECILKFTFAECNWKIVEFSTGNLIKLFHISEKIIKNNINLAWHWPYCFILGYSQLCVENCEHRVTKLKL